MPNLTPPSFLETNPANLVDDIVANFEASTGRTLYPAQVERLLIDLLSFRESLTRQAIQRAAEQNLVDFATGVNLEALGRLLGVSARLAATPSTATWTLTLPGVLGVDKVFAAGWIAMAPDGSAWQTSAPVTIPAGSLTASVGAQASIAGSVGNGIPSGSTFSPVENTATVASSTASAGGTDQETDDQLRARVLLAPFGFSVAGSAQAYRYHAMSADASIVDVAVANLGTGMVGVYPLTKTGLPTTAIKDAVTAALSGDTVRPLCDAVTVADPSRVNYPLEANLTFYSTADQTATMAAATAAGQAYLDNRRAGLGRDLIASQAIAALMVPGVYKVELVDWADTVLGASDWADGFLTLHNAGVALG